jgi:hypothetical protein
MSQLMATIDRHVGGAMMRVFDTVGNAYSAARDVITGNATVELKRLSDSEKTLKAAKAHAQQFTGLPEDQLKAIQAELHRELENRRRSKP